MNCGSWLVGIVPSERAGNPTIWESRLHRAEELEEEAAGAKVRK